MKSHRTSVLSLIAPVLFAGMAVAQNSNNPVPQCGNPQIENDTLFIVNPCGIAVNVTFTSWGDVWGGMPIGPGERARTGYSGEAVRRVGGVHVYTCSGYGTPVQPDGSPIISGYTGREYACHGSTQSQNQPQPDLQPGQSAQQQGQQGLSNPVPTNPWNKGVITPTASDAVVQQSDDTQQASDDDDDDDAQNTDTEDDTDQTTAILQQTQQMMQNVGSMIQNNAQIQAQPTRRGGNVPQSQCVGQRCY
jgi:hypothetical protein